MTVHVQRDTDVKKHVEHILDILAYIHSEKLAHNDIKVENLLLFKDGMRRLLKAGDWDSARRFGEPRNMQTTPCASQTSLTLHPDLDLKRAQTSALRSWPSSSEESSMSHSWWMTRTTSGLSASPPCT